MLGVRSWPWVLGALLGCVSHVVLDGMVHPEMQPFAPLIDGNPIYLGIIEPLSWALLPLCGWLTAQYVSGTQEWVTKRLAAAVRRYRPPPS
jgi:membrane-bound metal-dependent hydrolase YbcI (DUF457 family)